MASLGCWTARVFSASRLALAVPCALLAACAGGVPGGGAGPGEGGEAGGGTAGDGPGGVSDVSGTGGGEGDPDPSPDAGVAPGGAGGAGGQPSSTGGAGGTSPDAGTDPNVVPPGNFPIIVALGDGAWTMTSCDLGKSWKGNRDFSSERADHSQWTAFGGMAFGNGMFVGGLGWGFPGHVIAAADGATFAEIPDAQFTRNNMAEGLNDSIGGLAFTGSEFIAFSRWVWTSANGRDWKARATSWPRGVEQLRQLRAFPGKNLIVASVESQSGSGHAQGNFVIVSENAGATWIEGTGFRGSCAHPIQHAGDIEMLGDVLIVGVSDVCRSTDRGRTWEFIANPAGGEMSDLWSDGTAFYGVAGRKFMRSVDGKTWQVRSMLPADAQRGAFAGGQFAVLTARGDRAFHSVDGTAWQSVTPTNLGGSQWIRDVAVGHGPPSAVCPH